MSTFIHYLEELADAGRAITIPANELRRLVDRFGDRVRRMGRWDVSGDGSLDIPIEAIREAVARLPASALADAVQELKAGQFTQMIESSAAISLIEKVSDVYRRRFRDLMTRYQTTKNPSETVRLRDEIVREVFGTEADALN
jgi:hypothetical protein